MRPIRYSTGDRVIKVDPDSINTFVEVDDNPRAYKNKPSKGRIPGFGEKYDTCGQEDPHFCSDCGRPIRDGNGELASIGRTCWRKDCPRCAPGWAMRRSYKITSKIEDYRRHLADKRGGDSPKFHHVTLIPPYKADESRFRTNTEDPLDTMYSISKVILDELGAFGGAIAYHPFSGTSEDDRGEWRRRLFKGRSWEDDVREELHYRPHMHAIVVADSIDHLVCEAIYNQTGWVTHRIEKQGSNVSLYGKSDLASAVTYALSHAGTGEEISDTYRYFGDVANHTPSDSVSKEMRKVVRSVVPTTLDMDLGTTTCSLPDTTGDDESEDSPEHYTPPSASTGAGSGDESATTAGPKCGGRLVPLDEADSFFSEVEFGDELRRTYEQEIGATMTADD